MAAKTKTKKARKRPPIEELSAKAGEKRQEIAAIALLGVAIFLLVAIFSYRENFRIPQQEGEGPVNLCGLLGYFIADKFLFLFGSSSIMLFFFLGLWGGMLFVRRSVIGMWPKVFGIMTFTICLSVLFHLHAPYDSPNPADAVVSGRRPYGLGGMVGHWFEPAISSGFGGVGTYIFSLAAMAISFLLATEWCFYPILAATIRRWNERKERLAEEEILKSDRKDADDEDEDEEAEAASPEPLSAWLRLLPSWLRPKSDRAAAQAVMPAKSLVVKSADDPKPEEKKPTLVEKLTGKKKTEDEKKGTVPFSVPKPAPVDPLAGPPKEKRIPIVRPAKAGQFKLPPLDLLDEAERLNPSALEKEIKANAAVLEASLKSFQIDGRVVAAEKGPVVTMYELELAPGTKVSRIISLSDDLAISLKASSVRVVAPIPGKSTIGIEVPNSLRERVRLKELVTSPQYKKDLDAIPLFLGKDVGGKPLIDDLTQMPHLLIAGATGSGKSVMINAIISSILLTRSPDEVKLVLIDPKMVELQAFKNIPHLMCPVVTNPRKAAQILEWGCMKMDGRYELLSQVGVKNIATYNQLGEEEIRKRLGAAFTEGETPVHLPYIVVIIDELADLMLLAANEVETSITRLAQKSRAVGIHVILATQRPSADVITGLIKANLPTRIAFQVASKIDSRVILDNNGAEKLLGAGDMLYTPPRQATIWRAQASFVADPEIKRITTYLSEIAQPAFSQELIQTGTGTMAEAEDEFYDQAVRIVLEQQRGSASLLQRALGIGYTRASRLIDMMRRDGVVGEFKGSKSSEVNMTLKDWEAMQADKKKGPSAAASAPAAAPVPAPEQNHG